MEETVKKIEILLYNYFQACIDMMEAVYVFQREGELIAKKLSESPETIISEDNLYSSVAEIVDQTLERIKSQYPGSFGTSTFETNEHRLVFIECGQNAIMLSVFKLETLLSKVMPYGFLVAEKVARLIDEPELMVDLTVPNLFLGYELSFDPSVTNYPYIEFNVDPEQAQKEIHFKLCVIGEPAVGKTTLIYQFVHGKFLENYKPTLGISITNQVYNLQGFKQNQLNFMIWDVAGQKFFQRVRKYYYQGANVAFICYDVTRRESFDRVEFWYQDIRSVLPGIPIVIIGNKIDLFEDRQVSHMEGEQLARRLHCSFIETSAKSGEYVKDAFSIVGIGLFFKLYSTKNEK
ncbi:Rab family GTPase [Candidatus Harpocratesius sp.]